MPSRPPTPASPSSKPRIGRTLVFSLLPALVLLGLLALAEAGLRIFSPSETVALVRGLTYDGLSWKQVNRSCLARFFPAGSALIPELKPTLVLSRRPAGALRILCLGESSMFGTPYHAGATIPSILQKQLRHLFPGRTVEVVNLGASAINSNVIRALAPRTLELEPDLVVIYTGHNEFYGPDGVGASWLEKRIPGLTRLKYSLRTLRLVELVQRASLVPESISKYVHAMNALGLSRKVLATC